MYGGFCLFVFYVMVGLDSFFFLGCRFSVSTMNKELRHVCWAVLIALEIEGYMSFPSANELDSIWDSIPRLLRENFRRRGTLTKFPLCVDSSFRPLPKGGEIPPNRNEYYNGKKNVKREVYCNLAVVDIRGRISFARCGAVGGIGEHYVLRSSRFCQNIEEYLPHATCSHIGILADGLFVGVHPHIDSKLLLPYRGRLTAEQRAFNGTFAYLRSIVENVFGAVDALFQIIQHPGMYSYRVQPYITYACYLLYNAIRFRTGYICTFRMDYLYDDDE